jgi:hypothetical protein
MSQFVSSQGQPATPPLRSRTSRHNATGPYSDLTKPERTHTSPRNAYFQFKRIKRQQLKAENPDISNKDVSKEILKAWSELSPAERKLTPAHLPFTPSPIPAKTDPIPSSDMEEAETGQSESAPVESRPGLLATLGGALKQVAGYFLVRPF